jgi:glutamate/aspartate transport system substrate-binding protein
MHKILSAGLLTAGLLLSLSSPAAELTGTLKKIVDTGTLTIGHRESSVPFSYLDDRQQPVGYSMDLCMKVVETVKRELGLPQLRVALQPVTSANRIPLMTNGTVDLECGSTTNSMERQKQVAFGLTTFVTNVKVVVKKDSPIKSLGDLDGKPVSTTSGTTSVQLIRQHAKGKDVNFKVVYGKDHAESFLLLETGRTSAFVMDDILIAGLIANSRHPDAYRFLPEVLRTEPYGIMLRRDDAPFKALVDRTLAALMKSGEIERIYARWFTQPIPPRGINLNFPISDELKEAIRHPNDKGV